jgi:organic radical activating enzyme
MVGNLSNFLKHPCHNLCSGYVYGKLIFNNLKSFLSSILPGKLWVLSLEIPAVQHCNLRCAACDHAAPLLPEAFVSPDQLRDDLERLSQHMRVGEFRILGGEPLLHPNLGDLIEVARQSNISRRICLVTNGVLIHTLAPVLWKSLDRLWVTFYPGIRTGMSQAEIRQRCKDYRVKFTPVIIDHFQQLLLDKYNDDEKLVKTIFQKCAKAQRWHCYTILNGYFFRCATAPQTKIRLAMAGKDYPGYHMDGLDIQDRTILRGRLKDYAFSKQPLEACHYCLGSIGKMMPHFQLDK